MSPEKARYSVDASMLDFQQICLTLTTRCNVRCKKCYMPKDKEMAPRVLASSLKVLQPFAGNVFVGAGENLVSQNLGVFLQWLGREDVLCRATILTNGLLLDPDVPLYYGPKIKWGVTLDGMEQNEVAGLQLNMDIELVKSNIQKIKQSYPHQDMYLNYTLHRRNLGSLRAFLELAIDCRIREVYVTKLKVFESTDVDLLSQYDIDLTELKVVSFFHELQLMADAAGVTLKLPAASLHYRCKVEPMIDVEGHVSFCVGRETTFIGSIADPDLQEKWVRQLRWIVETNFKNDWCDKCENNRFTTTGVQAVSPGYIPERR